MKTYLVGGAVRDQLLGYPYSERDWLVVGATPEQMEALGYAQVGKDFPVFLHPESKEEYALARTERKSGHGYGGFQCTSSPDISVEEDLMRRDLTINAIAQDDMGELVDPYGGQQDIKARILRHVSPAFSEDPLRVLRAARFFARYYHLGFHFADETIELMTEISGSGELEHLSAERVWKETERALGEQHPEQYFLCLQQVGAATRLFAPLQDFSDSALERLSSARAAGLDTDQRLAALLVELDEPQLKKLAEQIKLPKRYSEFCLLSQLCYRATEQGELQSKSTLSLLQRLDPFRQPERFERLCALVRIQHRQLAEQLVLAFAACQGIEARQFAEAGLKGKAIGEALNKARLEAIEQALLT